MPRSKKGRRKWESQEEDYLMQMVKVGVQPEEAADRLDRTAIAVKMKAHQLGVKWEIIPVRQTKPMWNEDQVVRHPGQCPWEMWSRAMNQVGARQ